MVVLWIAGSVSLPVVVEWRLQCCMTVAPLRARRLPATEAIPHAPTMWCTGTVVSMASMEAIMGQPVVFDNGTGVMKAGVAGESRPSHVFPTYIATPKHRRVMTGGKMDGELCVRSAWRPVNVYCQGTVGMMPMLGVVC